MLIYDASANPLNNNEWAFPLTECFHVAAMALCIGTIVIVDFRLLGFSILPQTPYRLVRDMDVWTLIGFFVVIASGLLIFSSDPVHYWSNGPFQFKMAGLTVGIIYNYTVHRRVAQLDSPFAIKFVAAGVSLAIWLSLVFAGIFIAFV